MEIWDGTRHHVKLGMETDAENIFLCVLDPPVGRGRSDFEPGQASRRLLRRLGTGTCDRIEGRDGYGENRSVIDDAFRLRSAERC